MLFKREVESRMKAFGQQTTRATLFVLLSGLAQACSAPADNSNADSDMSSTAEIANVLAGVPDGVTTRFILSLTTSKDGTVRKAHVDSVTRALQQRGAKVEWLEGSPVVFASCEKQAIQAALESGYVVAVQVDKLSSPQK